MTGLANRLINRPILASIRTSAFRHNLNRVRELVPESKIWAVIKAKAYGHGLEGALQGLESTDGFALLDIEDAQWLRAQQWQGRILLFEGHGHHHLPVIDQNQTLVGILTQSDFVRAIHSSLQST